MAFHFVRHSNVFRFCFQFQKIYVLTLLTEPKIRTTDGMYLMDIADHWPLTTIRHFMIQQLSHSKEKSQYPQAKNQRYFVTINENNVCDPIGHQTVYKNVLVIRLNIVLYVVPLNGWMELNIDLISYTLVSYTYIIHVECRIRQIN